MDDRAGSRNTEVLVEQSVDQTIAGVPTEVWSTVGTLWAEVSTRQSDQWTRFGVEMSKKVQWLTFDWMDGQAITEFMRLTISGKVFDIQSIDRDEDLKRFVKIVAVENEADPVRTREEWRQEMRKGEIITLRRNDFDAGVQTCKARAIVTGYQPDELVGGIDQGARKVIIFADDVTFATPLVEGDQILLREGQPGAKTLTIEDADDSTHRIAGDLIVYEVTARGA